MGIRPDVSVIVIAYNDARRLPRAVGSVLAQSLGSVETVIVDDASSDATGAVADRFAAARPGRIRAAHLPENSGGCGRPRNTGVELARGAYVMFLDSDDVLDRHACMNMVAAAEETGADLVSGLCVRSYRGPPPKETPWYARLYRNRAVHGSVLERPDLLYDTLSTNKCYRRGFLAEHGLRFAEDVHYEDLLFTAEAYLAASRIATLPHRVYTWCVEPAADRPSISNRRGELRNLADRLEVHRRIDRAFLAHGAEHLKLAKDAKFLNHDLLLYLRDLRTRDEPHRARFRGLVAPYLAELHPGTLEAAGRLPAIAAYMVRRGDVDGAVAAAELARKRIPELGADLVERDGRIYWGGRHLQDARAREILDVTALGLRARPLSGLRPAVTVTELRRDGRRVTIAGRIANPLGRIPAGAGPAGTLELRDRRRPRRTLRIPVRLAHRSERIEWRAVFDSARRLRPVGFVDPVWDARLALRADGERFTVPVTAGRTGAGRVGADGTRLPARPRLTRLAGTHFRPYVTGRGELSFVLEGGGRLTGASLAGVRRAARSAAGRRAWRDVRRAVRSGRRLRARARRALTSRRTKIAVSNRVLTRLPVRRGTVVFESHLGRQYSDNPKYIYRELRRSGAAAKAIWSYDGSPEGFPSDAALVRRGSWAYYLALARAEFWVDNQGFPPGLRKREETTYIQTWHGSAYKRMGFDQPRLKNAPWAEQERYRRAVERYDCFLVRTVHDERTLVPGMGVTAELMPVGYPRNDPLVNGGRHDPELARELDALRRELGLDGDDREVILYAPTFREGRDGGPAALSGPPPFDVERFAAELGGSKILLVRPHYLSGLVLPPWTENTAGGAVRYAGHIADITPLLLLADALVTDRSSVMFDYALLDRPIIFFVPSGDGGTVDPGYFDLATWAPGPVVRDEDALFAVLAGLDGIRHGHAARRRAFVSRYGEHDRGTAARAVVDRFFAARPSGAYGEGARRG
ncbi:hypothetical protein GCM10010191_39110 [Actinomadura vinacea]|uniref:Glycosyltransferase 2-like domain-containing protein n=1 Tax=Actinomadura vinacea TaxID=115336 RepID=A0ABN3J871_9ACTN